MSSVDKLTIETPEQLQLEFTLAGVGSRFLALAVDTLIQWVIGVVLFIVAGIFFAFSFSFFSPGEGVIWVFALLLLIYFLVQFGYFAIFETVWSGQTPGKRALKLRVIKDSGRPITVVESIGRNLLRVVDSLPGMYGVGIISVLLSSRNKRLGDYVAGTVVVMEKPLEETQPQWTPAAVPAESLPYDSSRLTAAEVRLVEAFLQRRSHLDAALRRSTAQQVADRVGEVLGVPREERPSAEKFLESLLEHHRRTGHYR